MSEFGKKQKGNSGELGLSPTLTAPKTTGMGAGLKSITKTGQQSVKTPKSKTMADPFGKPSLFFKAETQKRVLPLTKFLEYRNSKKNKI